MVNHPKGFKESNNVEAAAKLCFIASELLPFDPEDRYNSLADTASELRAVSTRLHHEAHIMREDGA